SFAIDTNQGNISTLPDQVKDLICQSLKGSFVVLDVNNTPINVANTLGHITGRVNKLCLHPCIKNEINRNILKYIFSLFSSTPFQPQGGMFNKSNEMIPSFNQAETSICLQQDVNECGFIIVGTQSTSSLLGIRMIVQTLYKNRCFCNSCNDC